MRGPAAPHWLRERVTSPIQVCGMEIAALRRTIVERTIIISGKQTLTADDFEPQINSCSRTTTINSDGLTLEDMERHSIIASLKKHNNNLSHVALDLGLSRAALYRRLEKYDINYKK